MPMLMTDHSHHSRQHFATPTKALVLSSHHYKEKGEEKRIGCGICKNSCNLTRYSWFLLI